jgi:hypothetical protein
MSNGTWHTAKIISYGLSGEASRDKAQFAIGFEYIDGPNKGSTITFYGGFKSDAAQDFTEKQLRACDWNGDYEHPELTDKPVRICIEPDEYKGQVRDKVRSISKQKGGGFKPMEAGSLSSFAKSLKRAAPAASSSNGFGATEDEPDYGYGG